MTLNIALLSETFERAKKENGGLTRLGMRFYQRLFQQYPQVRPLFTTPPEAQHKKLMASVAAIISSVTQPERMLPYLHAMGIRHIQYGAISAHYPAVQENLVAVLGEHLSAEGEWTEAMKQNWEMAMQVVSDIMIQAAEHPKQYEMELAGAGFSPNGVRIDHQVKPWELASVS